ncbi:copper transporter [Micromonospora sp. DSM 115977]|uniref:Copper transporter n=1 Tax=Micromonospora reichwaldensis TaxID=3075516 RepID=A0ABU2X1P1_9ACTN|nr:copper transporter [Micromonospora sp. DSM 115977]MDT0532107.1 copper transporter [Micromonospora sp. DSM 115977]
MINFRYHVVSLTAVFLALAIGLVVGTAALNGPVADSLKENVNALRKDNQQMRQAVQSMEKELELEEEFAAQTAELLLPGKLTDKRVLVVGLPTGRDHTEGVLKMLQLAGAKVSRLDLQDKFINPDNNNNLLELAVTAARPTSAPTADLPSNSNGVETSSALLASVLLDRAAGATPVTEADRRAVLAAYINANYLTTEEPVTASAEAVILVSGQPYVDKDSAKKDESVLKVAEQFDQAGTLVVGGNGSAGGNLVAAVRSDPVLVQTISTVDNANTVQGQLVTALALVQQVTEKKAGQYGVADNATLLPRLPQ